MLELGGVMRIALYPRRMIARGHLAMHVLSTQDFL
jgi:hypothetical protein